MARKRAKSSSELDQVPTTSQSPAMERSPSEPPAFREGQYHHRHPMANTKTLVKYNGTEKPLTARTWMTMYERHASRLNCNQEDKLLYIDTFLEGDAVSWFATLITSEPDISWDELKENFFQRFDNSQDEPLTRLVDFKFNREMTIASYYQDMMRISEPLGFKPVNMIEALNLGLPAHYRSQLKAARPSSLGEWLDVATSWERESKKQSFPRKPFGPPGEANKEVKNRSFLPKGNSLNSTTTKKPPSPCFICAKHHNKPAEYHWSRECPNRRQVHTMEQGNEESSPEED